MQAQEGTAPFPKTRDATKLTLTLSQVRCDATSEAGVETCSNCRRLGVACQFSRVPMKRGPSKGYEQLVLRSWFILYRMGAAADEIC